MAGRYEPEAGLEIESACSAAIRDSLTEWAKHTQRYQDWTLANHHKPGLSHLTVGELGKEACEEGVFPAGSLEFGLHRAF
jgi:hypothetical protein